MGKGSHISIGKYEVTNYYLNVNKDVILSIVFHFYIMLRVGGGGGEGEAE